MGAPRETSWSPSLDWVGDLNCLTDDFPSLDGGHEFFPVDNFLSEALDALLGNEASHVNLPAGEHLWSPVPPPPDPTLAAGATAQSGHPLAAPEALPHQVPAPPVSPPLDTPDARAGESAGREALAGAAGEGRMHGGQPTNLQRNSNLSHASAPTAPAATAAATAPPQPQADATQATERPCAKRCRPPEQNRAAQVRW
jgi:hypothetical protein